LRAKGRGVAEHFGVEGAVDVLVGTLSKATGGVGGYVVAEPALIDCMRHHARPIVFIASLPAPIVTATIEALDLIEEKPERRASPWRNTERLVAGLRARGLDVCDTGARSCRPGPGT
jgi:7-keto-8-aminopelargonate synthetase-like enzyme